MYNMEKVIIFANDLMQVYVCTFNSGTVIQKFVKQ